MPDLVWLQQCLNEDSLNASLAAAAARERSFQLQASGLRIELSVSAGADRDSGATSKPRPARSDSHRSESNLRAAEPDHVLRFMIHVWRGRESLGSRVLSVQESECAALPDAVALVTLLLARNASSEPSNTAGAVESSPPAAGVATSASQPGDSEAPPRASSGLEPQASPNTQFGIGASVAGVLGALPSTAVALSLLAETAYAWFGFQLRGTLLWPQTRTIAEGSVRFEGYRVGLLGCLAWGLPPSSRFDVRACAGPTASLLRASGRGFRVDNGSTTKLAIHADLQLQAAWAVGHATWLRIHGGAGVALQRPRFLLGLGDASQISELPSPGVVAGELGLSVVQIF